MNKDRVILIKCNINDDVNEVDEDVDMRLLDWSNESFPTIGSHVACDRVIVASTSIRVMWNHKRSSRAHRVRCCCNVVFVTQTPWTDASLMLTELTNEARLHIIATLFDSASLRSTKPNTSLRVIVATSAPCSSRFHFVMDPHIELMKSGCRPGPELCDSIELSRDFVIESACNFCVHKNCTGLYQFLKSWNSCPHTPQKDFAARCCFRSVCTHEHQWL